MPFSDFIGDATFLDRLRALLAEGASSGSWNMSAERASHTDDRSRAAATKGSVPKRSGPAASRTIVLVGPAGIGKTTLAVMMGLALNCQEPSQPGDYCGHCASCRQIVPDWRDQDQLTETALAFRQQQVKSRAAELAPLVLQVHPQIAVLPPDGGLLTIHQVRWLSERAQLRPDRGRRWTFVLPDFDRARWLVQTALLKTLEEPPPGSVILALVRNPLELLPTVRSRALLLTLPPASEERMGALLASVRSGLSAPERRLLARLAQGCPGRALSLDLAAYRQLREEALTLLAAAAHAPGTSFRDTLQAAFTRTESAVAGGREGKERLESLVEILYSLLQDILYLISGHSEAVRNLDCRPQVTGLAQSFTMHKLALAIEEADRILSAARRNANRALALDAWAVRLAQA